MARKTANVHFKRKIPADLETSIIQISTTSSTKQGRTFWDCIYFCVMIRAVCSGFRSISASATKGDFDFDVEVKS